MEDSTQHYAAPSVFTNNGQIANMPFNHHLQIANTSNHHTTTISIHQSTSPPTSTMSATPPLTTVPLGFASQLREIQDNQS